MPVYEYECKACGRDFEYQQRMSDPDKTVCEACGGSLERLISRTAFTLKGGGWYKDLYASAKPEAKADAKPEAAASSDKAEKAPSTAAPAAAAPSSGGGDSSGGGSTGGGGSSTTSSIASAS